MPFFSVIIPNYNHATFLEERIRSVLSQSFADFELIILDDASKDQSMEIIDKFRGDPKVTSIIINEENSGSPFKQWQKGLSVAKGEWIWVAESDDIAAPDFLVQMHRIVQQDTQLVLAYCDAITRKENNNLVKTKFSELKNQLFHTKKWSEAYFNDGVQELHQCLKYRCTINNASSVVFLRSALIEKIEYVTGFRYHGDWFLYILLAQEGKIGYTPLTLNTYRDHSANDSKSKDYRLRSRKECFHILDYLVKQDEITDKTRLIEYFTEHYTGFGIMKDSALMKKGLFWEYRKINKALALQVLNQIILRKFKSKPLP